MPRTPLRRRLATWARRLRAPLQPKRAQTMASSRDRTRTRDSLSIFMFSYQVCNLLGSNMIFACTDLVLCYVRCQSVNILLSCFRFARLLGIYLSLLNLVLWDVIYMAWDSFFYVDRLEAFISLSFNPWLETGISWTGMRGINDPKKQNAISNKIEESQCAILCLQKIKREAFHGSYVKNLCPRRLSKFLFYI